MIGSRPTQIEATRREDLAPTAWTVQIPIRFQHCDPAGIIFTPRYFDIFQEAVEGFVCERLAIDYYDMHGHHGVALGYAHASSEFLSPSRMGDVLEVAVLVGNIGNASYELRLQGFRQGREVVRARLVIVVTRISDSRPQRIPEDLRDALEGYLASGGGTFELR